MSGSPSENRRSGIAKPIIVTGGPSYAPIDDVRRITNFSTGELGVLLANACAAAGHPVIAFRGVAATSPLDFDPGVDARPFTTNADLAAQLADLAPGPVAAVLHTAALGDYEVEFVADESGERLHHAKIPSRAGGLLVGLRPAPKILPQIRGWFPGATVVAWKYELDGSLEDALHKAAHQLEDGHADYSVVNGRAYGEGFGLLDGAGRIRHHSEKSALVDALVNLLAANGRNAAN